jgi:hypothetical protein
MIYGYSNRLEEYVSFTFFKVSDTAREQGCSMENFIDKGGNDSN